MPSKTKIYIHQWTWYQDTAGKVYLCTSAGWSQDPETKEWAPTIIELLPYLSCTPKTLTLDKMTQLLETKELTVLKLPY